jgi:hypothetical protein
MNEGLVSDWKDTLGLTIERIEEYITDEYDEEIEHTIIFFTNGKYVIQRDQSGYGATSSGLAGQHDYIDALLIISKSKKLT